MARIFQDVSSETPCRRTYFYTGGQYVEDESGQQVLRDQMYVEQLDPIDGPRYPVPIVLIHGKGQTGTNWLNKPDGGRGWASFFIEKGYRVYLVDATVRGRSPSAIKEEETLEIMGVETIESRFTATALYKKWPQALLHTQWPGRGVRGDPIFDQYFASTSPSLSSRQLQQGAQQRAGAALLDRIGRPVVIVGHSQGMMPTWLIADTRPQFIHSIIALEPAGPPFVEAADPTTIIRPYGLTTLPLTYSPAVHDPESELTRKEIHGAHPNQIQCFIQADDPPPRQLINFIDKPVLLVTGEASYHAPYDYATVEFLRQAGVMRTEHLLLAEHGVHGNGHMIFLEKNSDEIAALVEAWIQKSL